MGTFFLRAAFAIVIRPSGELVEVSANLRERVTVRYTLRRFQSGAKDRACIIDAIQIFQRPRLVVVRVAVARVGGDGLVVPTKRLLMSPGACVFLRYSVHAERVARLTGVQFQQLRKARRGGGVVRPWLHTRQTITSGYAA